MEGRFVYSSSGDMALSQNDQFTDVDPKEWEGLPGHWHLTASTQEAISHRIVTLLIPQKSGSRDYVSYFMDDQDHGVHVYFTNQGLPAGLRFLKHISLKNIFICVWHPLYKERVIMKKWIGVCLTALMAATAVAGCADKDKEETAGGASNAPQKLNSPSRCGHWLLTMLRNRLI